MNEYKFGDLYIGKKESFSYSVTEEKMREFMELTGDVNPLHVNREFAAEHGYPGRVVYGMLTASLISTLGGYYLPGRYCLIQQVECKFVSPAYMGDRLVVTGVVEELHENVERADIRVTITNQNDKKVVKAKLYVGFLE